MKVALFVYEMTLNSYNHGIVYGEEICALGMQKALLKRKNIECCDIITINILKYRELLGEKVSYDLVIHFSVPTIKIKGAINILFFQQFYEWNKHNIRDYIEEFDFVMTPGKALSEWYSEVIYFPLAVDMDFYCNKNKSSKYAYDVAFIGNRKMRDLNTYHKFLLPALYYNTAIYGAGWMEEGYEDYAPYYKGVLEYDDAPILYSSAKISLCIHNKEYRDKFQLVTDRSYHIISCNGFMISDPVPELIHLIPSGKGVIYTQGGEELKKTIDKYLNNEEARLEIINAGYGWIKENHTWEHRIEYLFNEINL